VIAIWIGVDRGDHFFNMGDHNLINPKTRLSNIVSEFQS